MKRNEIDGTVTLSIKGFDRLTDRDGSMMADIKREREMVDKLEEGVINGLVKFNLPYYGHPWDEGAIWYKPDEAIQKVVDIYKKRLDEEQEYTQKYISEYSYWKLFMWKLRRDNEKKKRLR